MREIAIVTGVLVLEPVGEVNDETVAADAICLDEEIPEDGNGA